MHYKQALDAISNVVTGQITGDPTQDVLIFLAMANNALNSAQAFGHDLQFKNRILVVGALERAFREALYLRSHSENDLILEKPLSKFGRILDKTYLEEITCASKV